MIVKLMTACGCTREIEIPGHDPRYQPEVRIIAQYYEEKLKSCKWPPISFDATFFHRYFRFTKKTETRDKRIIFIYEELPSRT
jgi:hypothetical protein